MTVTTHEIQEMITDAFKYWDRVPPLAQIRSMRELLAMHTGHYYDNATKRFFGTYNPHVPAKGITVECQRNAPQGINKYAITAWVMDGDKLFPNTVYRARTLQQADRLAVRLSEAWPS
jgi:hypothetical protein